MGAEAAPCQDRAVSPAGFVEPPAGLRYEAEFLDAFEQERLVGFVASLEFHEVWMHGVAARRTTRHFGVTYDYERRSVAATEPIPAELVALREEAAGFARLAADDLVECLVTRYPPGAGIGWHRDAPMFGSPVVGVSLGRECRMRFRRGKVGNWETCDITLVPGSIYGLSGAARWSWQHSIPASTGSAAAGGERYSVTYRTLRR